MMSAAGDVCVSLDNDVKNITDQSANELAQKEEDVDAAVQDPQLKDDSSEMETPPPLEITTVENTSRSSTPSEGNTPREYDTSSSSPSPIPDDGSEGFSRPKINLGRDISLMMKALNSLHSPEEKIAALCKKYADLLEQQKIKEKRMRGMERKAAQVVKEKDQLQKDLNKALLGKSKMESLARELNKQNKILKDETYNLSLNHSKEREQISAKFQAATSEISDKIESIAKRNEVLNEENREMSEKIAKLVEETVSRDKMVKAMLEQRDLQEQILALKAKKAEEERDVALMGQEALKEEIVKSNALCEGYVKQEKELRTQITYYSDRVADFQMTLDKSNKMFTTFRSEMDAMNLKMKDLERATATWKKNYEEAQEENQRILTQNLEQARTINQLKVKLTRLTNLSRALQAERNELAKNVRMKEKKCDTVKAEATSSNTVELPTVENVTNSNEPVTLNPALQSSEVEITPSEESSVSSTQEPNNSSENQEAENHSPMADDLRDSQTSDVQNSPAPTETIASSRMVQDAVQQTSVSSSIEEGKDAAVSSTTNEDPAQEEDDVQDDSVTSSEDAH